MKNKWYEYLWIAEVLYLILGIFNILFAWLGIIFFVLPIVLAIFTGSKVYCNRFCGRGQLFGMLGKKGKLSLNNRLPKFLKSPIFRYAFLTFFMAMFSLMLYNTYKVFTGAPLKETITLLWTFKLPWGWSDVSMISLGIAQFAFGFFGVMLTATTLGLITMFIFKPRSWCVYCPMGTMTQGICHIKNRRDIADSGRTS